MYPMYRNLLVRQEIKEINVNGSDSELVLPDKALVVLNVIAIGANPLDTQQSNDKQVKVLINQLNKFGIREEDISIEQQFIRPVIDPELGIINYESITYVRVSFYDLANLSEFFYNIRETNINIVEIIYSIEDLRQFYELALEKALMNAIDSAKVLAKTLGVTLTGLPKVVTETSDIGDIQNRIITEGVPIEESLFITVFASIKAKYILENV